MDLPDANSSTVALAHPTAAEKLLQFAKNGEAWRGALSPEGYIRRELHLADQAFTRDSGITYWVLVDTSEPTAPRRVLCGCETFRKAAVVAYGGTVQDVVGHGVGSVFCPVEHRRRGYAQRMMKELGIKLRHHQAQDTGTQSMFSILYSDIGKQFYSACGWRVFPSSHVSISSTSTNSLPTELALPAVKSLEAPDLAPLCRLDEENLRASFLARSTKDPPAVAVIPDVQTIRWHHAREEFFGKEVLGRIPNIKGALIEGLDGQKHAWCYWTRMWNSANVTERKGNILHILRLVVLEADAPAGTESANKQKNGMHPAQWGTERDRILAVEALLRAAQVQAAEWKMEGVEVWNPTSQTLAAAQRIQSNAKEVNRDTESITSLMWFGPAQLDTSIEWVGNEKYGWC